MSINKNLKELRLQRKLTQGELAELAKIELTQVSRIERGASEPKLETIKKLAIALQCTTDELIMEKGSGIKEPQYLKVLLKRINDLSPLKKYIVVDMLQSYLNANQIKEPSIMEQFGAKNEDESYYEYIKIREYFEILEDENEKAEELSRNIYHEMMALGESIHKK